MSEEQKSVMGPRRLFILLALGAVVFYYLSTGEVKESEEDVPKIEEKAENLDLVDESNAVTVENITNTTNNTTSTVKIPEPQSTTEEIDDDYIPQSFGNNDGHTPQSSVNSDEYNPQSSE